MSDLPRLIYQSGLNPSAGYLLSFFWGWINVEDKLRGGPHFLYFSIETLSNWRNVGQRAINSAIGELQAARFLSENVYHHGNRGWWVLTPAGFEDHNQPPDRSIEEATLDSNRRLAERRSGVPRPSEGGDRRVRDRRSTIPEMHDRSSTNDLSGGDRRSIVQRSAIPEMHDRSSTDDLSGGDRRSILQRSAINLAAPKEKPEKHEKPEEQLEKRARVSVPQVAAELVRAAPCPPGCAELGTSGHELRCLVALLGQADLEGDAAIRACVELVAGVLRRAPELVQRGLQDPKFYAPEMFHGERWSRWVIAFRKLELETRQAAIEAETRAVAAAAAAAAAESQRRQQERESIAQLLADLQRRTETQPPLDPYEQLAARDGVGAFAAQLLRPSEALVAARAVVDRAVAAGREPGLDELHAAVAGVLPAPGRVPPPASSPPALALVRSAPVAPASALPAALAELDLATLEVPQLLELRDQLMTGITAASNSGDDALALALSRLRMNVMRELANTVQGPSVGIRPIAALLGVRDA